MLSKTLLIGAAAAFALSAAAPAFAQNEPSPGNTPAPSTPGNPMPSPDSSRATNTPSADSAGTTSSATETNWIGVQVLDNKGKKVGRIERVITSAEGGAPDQVQLRVNGKTVVIPTATLTLSSGVARSSLGLTEIEASTPDSR